MGGESASKARRLLDSGPGDRFTRGHQEQLWGRRIDFLLLRLQCDEFWWRNAPNKKEVRCCRSVFHVHFSEEMSRILVTGCFRVSTFSTLDGFLVASSQFRPACTFVRQPIWFSFDRFKISCLGVRIRDDKSCWNRPMKLYRREFSESKDESVVRTTILCDCVLPILQLLKSDRWIRHFTAVCCSGSCTSVQSVWHLRQVDCENIITAAVTCLAAPNNSPVGAGFRLPVGILINSQLFCFFLWRLCQPLTQSTFIFEFWIFVCGVSEREVQTCYSLVGGVKNLLWAVLNFSQSTSRAHNQESLTGAGLIREKGHRRPRNAGLLGLWFGWSGMDGTLAIARSSCDLEFTVFLWLEIFNRKQ